MHRIVALAIFTTRRQEELARQQIADVEMTHKRMLVRDMKHPGEKIGNDMWCELPDEAVIIIGDSSLHSNDSANIGGFDEADSRALLGRRDELGHPFDDVDLLLPLPVLQKEHPGLAAHHELEDA